MVSSLISPYHGVFDVLTTYDLVTRAGRGLVTTAIAGTCVKICLNSLLALPAQMHEMDSFAKIVVTAVLTGAVAYKCVTRIIKEIKAPLHEKEISQLLEDLSKDEAVLILQAKRDWSGDITCQTRSTMKILKELSSRYSLFKERVGSAQEINQAIDKVNKTGKKIKMVVVVAHGSPSGIMLGSFIGTDLNSNTVAQLNFKAIEGSKLVLLSCYGGVFAKTIQKAAGSTIEIEGASSMLGPRCFKIKDLEVPMFSFTSPFFPGDTTVHMNHEKANDNSLRTRLTHQLSEFVGHMSEVVIGIGIAAFIHYAD